IFCTHPTAPLSELVMRDSAEIQMEDLAYKQRRMAKQNRQPRYPAEPLYTVEDVAATMPFVQPVGYGQPVALPPNVSAKFHDAGHILGSAMIEVTAKENGVTRTILFSGDIGQRDKPFIRDPSFFEQADYVVMESTYGDREHEQAGDVQTQLAE